jgi:hypothetical protein
MNNEEDINQLQPSLLKRFWWVFLIPVILFAVVGYVAYAGKQHDKKLQVQNQAAKGLEADSKPADTANPQPSDIVIVANPVDLTQFAAISKFRSCSGHVFGETTAFEGREAASSLKHYFVFDPKYENTTGTVPVYIGRGMVRPLEPPAIRLNMPVPSDS